MNHQAARDAGCAKNAKALKRARNARRNPRGADGR